MQTDTFTFSCNIQHLDQQYSTHDVQGAYTLEVMLCQRMLQHFNGRKGWADKNQGLVNQML